MTWPAEDGHKLFTILCDLKAAGNSKTDWKRIMEIFNDQMGKAHKKSKGQAKNYVGTCKDKYIAWIELNKLSGIAFENGLPVAAEMGLERMEAFIQRYAYGAYVTKHKLPDLPLWEQYFGEKYATGSISCSPAVAKTHSKSRNLKRKGSEINLEAFDEGSGDSDEAHTDSAGVMEFSAPAHSWSPKEAPSPKRRSIGSMSVDSVKVGRAGKSEVNLLKLNDVLTRQTDKLFLAVAGMEEAKKRGDLFISNAIKYLMEHNFERMFLRLENDIQRWEWIKHLDGLVDDSRMG